MKRFVTGRRLWGALVALALVTVPAVLLKSRTAEAFTLPNLILSFDPLAVPRDHSLHVHMVNQFGQDPVIVQPVLTTATLGGSPVFLRGTIVTLNPGEGTEEAFPFVDLTPPPGADRVAVVPAVWASLVLASPPPRSGTGRRNGDPPVEVVDDLTGHQIARLRRPHVVAPEGDRAPLDFCLFCNRAPTRMKPAAVLRPRVLLWLAAAMSPGPRDGAGDGGGAGCSPYFGYSIYVWGTTIAWSGRDGRRLRAIRPAGRHEPGGGTRFLRHSWLAPAGRPWPR